MQVGLYQFWHRERTRGFGASVQDRDDVVQDLMVSVLERKWPGRRLLDGRITSITPALLAQHLQFWLRRRLASTNAHHKTHTPLPEDDAEQAELHSDDELESIGIDVFLAAPYEAQQGTRATAAFEARCYVAARKCVAALDDRARHAIDLILGVEYLDDAEANQQLVAAQLVVSEATVTRILQRLGINQSRAWKAAIDHESWRRTPLGQYLIEDCKVQRNDLNSLEIAVRTLAWCNRHHLRALRTGQAQPAAQP